MPWELLGLYMKLPVFALVASRLGGMLMLQPLMSSLAIPTNLRVLLILALAALITPLVPAPANAPESIVELAIAIGHELLLGGAMGLALAACLSGVQIGAQLVAQESGLAFGQIADPTLDQDETALGVFYLQLSAVVYLVAGGHRLMVATCLDTFESLPLLAGGGSLADVAELLTAALAAGGALALRVGAPTLVTLLLVNMALGFASRTIPQLNVTTLGFSLKSLLGFVFIAVSLPIVMGSVVEALQAVFEGVQAM